jgi:hypothetical protein
LDIIHDLVIPKANHCVALCMKEPRPLRVGLFRAVRSVGFPIQFNDEARTTGDEVANELPDRELATEPYARQLAATQMLPENTLSRCGIGP